MNNAVFKAPEPVIEEVTELSKDSRWPVYLHTIGLLDHAVLRDGHMSIDEAKAKDEQRREVIRSRHFTSRRSDDHSKPDYTAVEKKPTRISIYDLDVKLLKHMAKIRKDIMLDKFTITESPVDAGAVRFFNEHSRYLTDEEREIVSPHARQKEYRREIYHYCKFVPNTERRTSYEKQLYERSITQKNIKLIKALNEMAILTANTALDSDDAYSVIRFD